MGLLLIPLLLSLAASSAANVALAQVKKKLLEIVQEVASKTETTYAEALDKDGKYQMVCPDVLHKCGFDPEATGGERPAQLNFTTPDLEYNPIYGQSVSFQKATVYMTRSADRDSDEVKALQCAAEGLSTDFSRFWKFYGSPTDRYFQMNFFHQGTGSILQYPARMWGKGEDPGAPGHEFSAEAEKRYNSRCIGPKSNDYDVRSRSWYTQSVTGPKDIVLVIDASASMVQHGRDELAKSAAKRIVGALNAGDSISLVTFSSSADVYGMKKQLHQATEGVKEEIYWWIDSITFKGGTNYEAGLTTALDIFRSSKKVTRTCTDTNATTTEHCRRLVMFLTDGQITQGLGIDELIPALQETNAEVEASLLTYSLGAEADQMSTRNLACGLNGIWWHVDDQEDLGSVMSQYYQMLAVSLPDLSPRRKWSYYFYMVSNSMDMTVCQSVYDRSKLPAILLGQVCVTANLIEPYEKIMNAGDFSTELLTMGMENLKCTSPKLSASQMQLIRQKITPGGCGICPSASSAHLPPSCGNSAGSSGGSTGTDGTQVSGSTSMYGTARTMAAYGMRLACLSVCFLW